MFRDISKKFQVQVVAKSANEAGKEIGSIKLRYPRIIHSEFMTHRVFSRNASSSRAIPVNRLVTTTEDDYFIPLFRKNKPGMQPGAYLSDSEQAEAEFLWKRAMNECIRTAEELGRKEGLNVHKQWANRMLEWFGYINVLVTSTEWSNFFALRTESNRDGSPVPQDEMYQLAWMMKKALDESPARKLKNGEWHLPFILDEERDKYDISELIQLSVARSASISYETVDGELMTPDRALSLYDKLLAKHPIHASPAEHQAQAIIDTPESMYANHLQGNFTGGWLQYRKLLSGECL